MRKILLLAVLLSGTGRLIAQNNLQPQSSIPDNNFFKPLKPIILDSIISVPLQNVKQFYTSDGSLTIAGVHANIYHMPIAVLKGQSNMPVYKLEGNSKMPVLGADKNKITPAIKAIP